MNAYKSLWKYLVPLSITWIVITVFLDYINTPPDPCSFLCGMIDSKDILQPVLFPISGLLETAIIFMLLTPCLITIAKPSIDQVIVACAPTMKSSTDMLVAELVDTITALKKSIDDRGFNFVVSPDSFDVDRILNNELHKKTQLYESSMPKEGDEKETTAIHAKVQLAQQKVEQGSYLEGINLYKEIIRTHDNPPTNKLLLSAYAQVLDEEEIQGLNRDQLLTEAEAMLPTYGDPVHYLTIAYNLWGNGDINGAIRVAEAGYAHYDKLNSETNPAVLGLANSLAYYYADANDTSKKQRAQELITHAVEYWRQQLETCRDKNESIHNRYTNCLDTQGYVKIVYANSVDDLKDGCSKCLKAHKMGTSEELLLKHMGTFNKRLAELCKN